MNDFSLTSESFQATEATVAAITPAGVAAMAAVFGAGALSVVLPKSRAMGLVDHLDQLVRKGVAL